MAAEIKFNTQQQRSTPKDGGCFTCRFASDRFGRPFCEVHRIVPSLPKDGCGAREREPGSDDEQFWARPEPRSGIFG